MNLKEKDTSLTARIFEKIPPFLTWTLVLFPFWGGFLLPQITAYVVIVINVYFFYRSITFAVFFVMGLLRLRASEAVDWMNRLRELDDIDSAINKLNQKLETVKELDFQKAEEGTNRKLARSFRVPNFMRDFVFGLERRKAENFIKSEIKRLEKIKKEGLQFDWKELHHIVIIPHWKEPYNVLNDTLNNLKQSNYPTKKISIVLGAEMRDPEGLEKSKKLKQAYQQHFENIWISNHELKENEIIGKSSNMAAAGKHAKTQIEKAGWDFKSVIITSCDADSLIPADYFANVSYLYSTIQDSFYKYYNAAILFYANIWKLPFYARVKNSMSSIYNMSKLVRTDKFVPFSTYSVSFWMVDQIGYWTPWVTPEDYHLFFKGVFKFPDKVSTVPVYQKIMADAAEGDDHVSTIKNSYFQERRWSWGVSDDGWIIKQILKGIKSGNMTISALWKSTHVLFDHILGVALTMIIVVGGNIPPLINEQFAGTVLGSNLPQVSSLIVRSTIVLLVGVILIDLFLLKPQNPFKKTTLLGKLLTLLEWFALPYAGIVLVILPGIEAHTRLLFGKYLEYYLTKKK